MHECNPEGGWGRRAPPSPVLNWKPRRERSALVISGLAVRARWLASPMAAVHWQVRSCGSVASAVEQWQRGGWDLVMVDLIGGERTEWHLRQVCEECGPAARGLWVIIGHVDEPAEEVWARGLGAWLYLPGCNDPHQVAWVCEQAEQVLPSGIWG